MTRDEKIREINKLDNENYKILKVIDGFDLDNPDNATYELTRDGFRRSYDGGGYSVEIKNEILIKVIEMLKNKVDENNKKLDELLGVDNDEEPKYCAKIKGWELVNHVIYFEEINEKLCTNYKHFNVQSKTKSEWNKLGINDTNADFEAVEEND